MSQNLLQLLRRITRQGVATVGRPVRNIHGGAPQAPSYSTALGDSSWHVLGVPGQELLDLEDFYNVYSAGSQGYQFLEAPNGYAMYESATPEVRLFRGAVVLESTSTLELEVVLGSAQGTVAVYVDGVLQRRGTGSVALARMLDIGSHIIEIMTAGAQTEIRVTGVAIDGTVDVLQAPVVESVETGYMDTTTGTALVRLRWFVDPRVGGWRVLRRLPTPLGTIAEVGAVDASGTFIVAITGDFASSIAIGADLLAESEFMGSALLAWYDLATTRTLVRVRLAAGEVRTAWVGRNAFTSNYVEAGRVARAIGSGVQVWEDTSVRTGATYYYVVQAYSLFDESQVGPLSALQRIRAGDLTPPDPILIKDMGVPTTGYPRVRFSVATVKFRTPEDDDYAGVRVYRRQKVSSSVTSVSGTTIGLSSLGTAGSKVGWTVRMENGTAGGAYRTVLSNTTTTAVVDSAFDTTPTVGDTALIFLDEQMLTDYGLPGTDDELSFEVPAYGEYQFRSFDHAGNEQADVDAVSWTYSSANDVPVLANVPPTIRLEQLDAAAQASFTGYTDTELYAVLKLTAEDAAQANPTDGITIHYRRKGESTYTMPASTAAVAGVADNPAGTRSRFVAMARQADDAFIEVWSSDAAGVESDHLLYLIDFDSSPEVTSVEHIYDIGNERVYATLVVDDDTQGVRVWMEPATNVGAGDAPDYTAASPLHLDMRTLKSRQLTVQLKDGTRKRIFVQPWTLYSGVTAQGNAGETVNRELVRSPRTSVTFESRDEQGGVSSTRVRANIYVVPAPAVYASRAAAATGNTTTRIVDSGSPGWSTGQFAYSEALNQYYFVEVTSGALAGQVRRIVANTAGYLDVDTPFASAPNSQTYKLWSGGTIWQVDNSPTAYLVDNKTFFDRKSDASTVVTYRSVIAGSAPEPLRKTSVDADTSPHIEKLTAVEGAGQLVTITVTSDDPATKPAFDDDCKFWRLYAKKGGTFPTKTGNAPARDAASGRYNMDDTFLRWQDTPANPSVAFTCGSGEWKFIAVPFNSANEDGDYREAQLTVSGSSAGLTNVQVTGSGSSDNVISFSTRNFTAGDVGYTVSITGQEIDLAGAPVGAPVAVATDVSTSPTSRTHAGLGTRVAAGSGKWRVWRYTVVLSNAGSPIGTYTCELGDYWLRDAVGLSTANSGVYSSGHMNGLKCGSSMINNVMWTTSGVNNTDYSIEIDLEVDNSGVTNLLAGGLAPSTGEYLHFIDGKVADVGGAESGSWKYTVRLVRHSDNAVIGQLLTTVTSNYDLCSEN